MPGQIADLIIDNAAHLRLDCRADQKWFEVECLRTLDRLRLRTVLGDREIAGRRETVFRLLEAVEVVELSRPVLARAAQPLPTEHGSFDAIHLATTLLWREGSGTDLVMATHDESLGTAARACGLKVVGVA